MFEYPILFNRMLIFDGSYALHRALSVIDQFTLKTSTGIGTGGVLGVLRTIQKEMKTYNYFPVVVFDGGLSKRRLELYPNYKKAQEKQLLLECKEEDKTEEQRAYEDFMKEYRSQRNILIELLPLLGIPCIRLEGWEGDDLLYILSKMTLNSIVVTDDKDLLQLIKQPTEADNRICRIRRALNDQFWDINSLKELEIDNIPTFIARKSIIGDPSDNIPSACEGVGEKTALGLVKILENVLSFGIPFPQDENELEKMCKELNISKRKAYLNFDFDQYKINYLLTDISKIDWNMDSIVIDELRNKIYDTIYNTEDVIIDRMKDAKLILKELEINSFSPDSLREQVNYVEKTILLDNMEECKTLPEINKQSSGKLFQI